jgi:hypothetical protein
MFNWEPVFIVPVWLKEVYVVFLLCHSFSFVRTGRLQKISSLLYNDVVPTCESFCNVRSYAVTCISAGLKQLLGMLWSQNVASVMSNPKICILNSILPKTKDIRQSFLLRSRIDIDSGSLCYWRCMNTSNFKLHRNFMFHAVLFRGRKTSIVNQNKGKILNFKRVVWIWVYKLVFIRLCYICLQVWKFLYSVSLRDLLSVSFVTFLLATNKLTVIVIMRQYVVVVENIWQICWNRGFAGHLVQSGCQFKCYANRYSVWICWLSFQSRM